MTLRIAQVAPLYESVPPRLYGGTERVVATLTDALVAAGHDVTLFASGDSRTAATLVPCCPQALRLAGARAPMVAHILLLARVLERAHELDVIHYHIDCLHFPLSRRLDVPHLTTLHGRLDLPELQPLFDEFSDMPVVSISNAQRGPLPQAGWLATVHHGLAPDAFSLERRPGHYLAFVGRISPEKRVDRAIEIARRAGLPLRIAAKIDDDDLAYFQREIQAMLALPGVEYLGELDDQHKGELLGHARALLFPIDWPEPFGLVMIEAMACGTPVIAFRGGSVTEVVDHGVTGFVVEGIDEAVDALARVGELDRGHIRAVFERRFSAERMADDYCRLYERLVDRRRVELGHHSRANAVA